MEPLNIHSRLQQSATHCLIVISYEQRQQVFGIIFSRRNPKLMFLIQIENLNTKSDLFAA